MLDRPNLVPLGVALTDLAAGCCRWPVGEIDHTLIELTPAVSPGPDHGGLGLKSGTPLIRLLETHYDQENRPVALSTVDVADDLVRFHVVRQG